MQTALRTGPSQENASECQAGLAGCSQALALATVTAHLHDVKVPDLGQGSIVCVLGQGYTLGCLQTLLSAQGLLLLSLVCDTGIASCHNLSITVSDLLMLPPPFKKQDCAGQSLPRD